MTSVTGLIEPPAKDTSRNTYCRRRPKLRLSMRKSHRFFTASTPNGTERLLLVWVMYTVLVPSARAVETQWTYQSDGKSYHYRIKPAGDSYHFEFDNQPESRTEQYKALKHVLQSIYHDPSIDFDDRQDYLRERAQCSFFASNLYNYTLCILPNEFSANRPQSFGGFVTQRQSALWFLTRLVLPLALAAGLLQFLLKRRPNKQQGH